VFVAGLVSGVVPQPPAASAIYTDGDIGELESAGIVLDSKKGRSARERLLFHHTLTLARRRLHLSWHARSREDKELGASPFIADVRELVEPHVSLNDVRTRVAPPLDDAMNVRDLRNAAALRDVMIDAFARELAPARAAAAIERRRYQSVPFDAFDGMIAETELLARLAEHYGSAHYFSARQLETYARCPFRFLAQEVFRLELPEDPTQELDKRLRGTIMHEALQLFHTQFRGRPVAELGPKEADAAMRDAVAAAFDACTPRDHTTPPAVLTAEAARMTQHLLRYLEHERASNGAWRPAHFEVSFGGTLRGEADAWSRAEPFELKTAAGTILVSGKIDRVDEGDAGLRVVDYKTSITQHSSRAMDDGVDIQLMLYVLALERAIAPGLPPQHAEYVWVGRNQSRDALGKTAHERQATMLEKLAMYVEGIRRGVFSPSPYHDSCTYCDMRRVCRYEEGRITRKIDA
jgi:ATP-dependent helicase/DNAse subunit B